MARYPISLWNIYQRVVDGLPRTNNAVEGWHNAFRQSVGCAHPTVTTLISHLQMEQANIEINLMRLAGGVLQHKPSKKIYGQRDKIFKSKAAAYNTMTAIDYLRDIASLLKLSYNGSFAY